MQDQAESESYYSDQQGLRLIVTKFLDGLWQAAVFKDRALIAGPGGHHSNRTEAQDDAQERAEAILGKKLNEIIWTDNPVPRK